MSLFQEFKCLYADLSSGLTSDDFLQVILAAISAIASTVSISAGTTMLRIIISLLRTIKHKGFDSGFVRRMFHF